MFYQDPPDWAIGAFFAANEKRAYVHTPGAILLQRRTVTHKSCSCFSNVFCLRSDLFEHVGHVSSKQHVINWEKKEQHQHSEEHVQNDLGERVPASWDACKEREKMTLPARGPDLPYLPVWPAPRKGNWGVGELIWPDDLQIDMQAQVCDFVVPSFGSSLHTHSQSPLLTRVLADFRTRLPSPPRKVQGVEAKACNTAAVRKLIVRVLSSKEQVPQGKNERYSLTGTEGGCAAIVVTRPRRLSPVQDCYNRGRGCTRRHPRAADPPTAGGGARGPTVRGPAGGPFPD